MMSHLANGGGVSGGVVTSGGGIDIDDMPPPPRGGTLWSQSYRDVRDVMAMSHSRDNTLSRDNHHHSVSHWIITSASFEGIFGGIILF